MLAGPVFSVRMSARGVSVSASVALLLPGVGSVTPPGGATVAVLLKVPLALASIIALTVNVTLAPAGRFTFALMSPLPPTGQVPPPAPTQVQLDDVIYAGNVSATVAPTTLLGPGLLATIT